MNNIMLNEEDFKCLVRGGVLRVNENINLALQDIGFLRMYEAIGKAEECIDIFKPRDKEEDK